MDINWSTKLYCLIGNPIEKSLSPIIHNKVFKELKINSKYLAFNIEEDELKDTINGIRAINIKGFNVTIPYKRKIIKYLDHISPEAKTIGAVNTVKNQNGKLIGYNTDGEGFLKTFHDSNIDLNNKNILLLGSGGAAYGIGAALAGTQVNRIYINNRSIDNAINLKEKLELINSNILYDIGNLSLKNIDKKNIHIIINTTSVGMYPLENLSPIELNGFSENTIIYDIVYKPKQTQLIKDGINKNYRIFGGLSMLINQAILSQKIWLDFDEKTNKELFKKIEKSLYSYL